MDIFQEIIQKFINYIYSRQYEGTFHSRYKQTIYDKWLQLKFQEFVNEYYEVQTNKSFQQQKEENQSFYTVVEQQRSGQLNKHYKKQRKIGFQGAKKHLWELHQAQKLQKNPISNPQCNTISQNKQGNKSQILIQQDNICFSKIRNKLYKVCKQWVLPWLQNGDKINENNQNWNQRLNVLALYQDAQKTDTNFLGYQNSRMVFLLDNNKKQNNPKTSGNYQIFEECQAKVINPNIFLYSNYINTIFQTESKKLQQYHLTKPTNFINKIAPLIFPTSIILTTTNLLTILSSIAMLNFIYYYQFIRQYKTQNDSSFQDYLQFISRLYHVKFFNQRKQIIKIITTKQIYLKYLQTFVFIRKLTEFTNNQTINFFKQKFFNQISQISIEIQKLNAYFNDFKIQKSNILKNISCCFFQNFHFYIIKVGQQIVYQNLRFKFVDHNLFPYLTYDLQIYHLQNGEFNILIEQQNLKNVKNIYFAHKKELISEELYLNLIKRLQRKQFIDKNRNQIYYLKLKQSDLDKNKIQQVIKCRFKLFFFYLQHKNEKKFSQNSLIKKNSQASKYFQLFNNQYCSKKNIKFKQPGQLSDQQKNQVFIKLRSIQQLALLSDNDLTEILKESLILYFNKDQVLYNSSMNLEYVFVVLRGVCLIEEGQSLQKIKWIKQKNLFGWRYFLFCQNKWKKPEFQNQKKKNFKAFSSKVQILRIPISFLEYLLFDKIYKIQQTHLNIGNIDRNETQNFLKFKQILIPQIKLQKNINNQYIKNLQNQVFLYKLLSVRVKQIVDLKKKCEKNRSSKLNLQLQLNNKILQVFFYNYPKLMLIF